jgi:phosphatidylglycerophosphate synthase
MSGKLKMLVQCLAVLLSLFGLYYGATYGMPYPGVLEWSLTIAVWASVVLTVYSGAAYVHRAFLLLSGQ